MGNEPLSHFEEEILGLMSPLRRFVWEGADKTINGRQMEVIVNGSIPEGYEEDWSKVIVSIIDITERAGCNSNSANFHAQWNRVVRRLSSPTLLAILNMSIQSSQKSLAILMRK